MYALIVKNICKSFLKKRTEEKILDKCSFNISKGEIFGLAGLNGAGKTTLIKIILDLQQADNGEIKIFGIDNLYTKAREKVCYLPEKFYPSPYLTGYEFLKLSLSFAKKRLNATELDEMAQRINLDVKALDKMIKKYSKGMGQKLGILSCLLSGANLLILDEPMSGLDPKARVLLKQLLLEYAKKGNTIFFSSHIIDDIEEICDKMAVLDRGNIKYLGTPTEFRKKYPAESAEKSFLRCIE